MFALGSSIQGATFTYELVVVETTLAIVLTEVLTGLLGTIGPRIIPRWTFTYGVLSGGALVLTDSAIGAKSHRLLGATLLTSLTCK